MKNKKIKEDLIQSYRGRVVENTSKKYFLLKNLLDYILITIGCFIMAASVSLILVPNELSTGGFSGIALIFYYFSHIQMGIAIVLLNIPLLVIAYFKIGKVFLFKTIYGIITFANFIDLLETLSPVTEDRFLACVYGGVLTGIGTAIVLKGSGSTGGSDLVSYILKTFKPSVRVSSAIFVFDFIVIMLNIFFFQKIEIGLYSAIAIYLMGKMIDIFFEGTNFGKALFIISPKYQEIAQSLGVEMKRGSTGIYAKGMYTDEQRMMLLCVGSRNEAYSMQTIAKKIDKNAFIIIINAREILGKGFQ